MCHKCKELPTTEQPDESTTIDMTPDTSWDQTPEDEPATVETDHDTSPHDNDSPDSGNILPGGGMPWGFRNVETGEIINSYMTER